MIFYFISLRKKFWVHVKHLCQFVSNTIICAALGEPSELSLFLAHSNLLEDNICTSCDPWCCQELGMTHCSWLICSERKCHDFSEPKTPVHWTSFVLPCTSLRAGYASVVPASDQFVKRVHIAMRQFPPPVLASFMSTWHKLESPERREPQLRNCFPKIGVWASL